MAITALTNTVEYLTRSGRFRQAADREKEIAQIYVQDQQDLANGCKSYKRAGEWYDQEGATAYVVISVTAHRC